MKKKNLFNKEWWLKNLWLPALIVLIGAVATALLSSSNTNFEIRDNFGVVAKDINGNVIVNPGEEKDSRLSNERSNKTKKLEPIEIVTKFFDYLNEGQYIEACSLLSLRYCDTEDQTSVLALGREKSNTVNGYENLIILDSGKSADSKSIICVKFGYELSANSTGKLWYFYQYHLEKNDQGYYHIVKRVPEKKFHEKLGEQFIRDAAVTPLCHGVVFE